MNRHHLKLVLIFLFCILSGCGLLSQPTGYSPSNTFLETRSPHTPTLKDTAQRTPEKPDLTADKFKIMHAYQFKVEKVDGICEDEAIVIAQSEVIFRGYDKEYYLTKPRIKKDDDAVWMVEFYPVNKTFIDSISKPKLLITVNKKDGKLSWSFDS